MQCITVIYGSVQFAWLYFAFALVHTCTACMQLLRTNKDKLITACMSASLRVQDTWSKGYWVLDMNVQCFKG